MGFWNKKDELEEELQDKFISQAELKPEVIAPVSAKSPTVMEGENTMQSVAVKPTSEETPANFADDLGLERVGKVRSALGPGTVIQGKLSFDTPVRIDGKLSGEIYSTKALIVGASGTIDAQIQVASLIVLGEVKGSIKASERIEILPGGKLIGDIKTPLLSIQEGGLFDGACSMKGLASSDSPAVFSSESSTKETKADAGNKKPSDPTKPDRVSDKGSARTDKEIRAL